MTDEQRINIWMKSLVETGFAIFTVIFLIKLNMMNTTLNNIVDTSDAFKVIMFNNGQPALFALGAFLLVLLAVVISFWCWHRPNYERYADSEILLAIISTILNIIFVILILIFINNPILRSIIVVGGIGLIALYVVGSQ
ncbi:hypothetical protein WOSG25_070440 [Weissella oryzae SG25]|uniref:Uncharacterized protein n=1 Tax=Weissella oryzae (strain DSM 25784 / JCM 18191 / LMG 30913 / SG25) TaxID=1329250 RepID=A0A069CUI9_WEIOS|nr:hypothetical protein [Weissella oryzae]GAK31067.1 hypothetical protein WOSG25_070440 [Weissella oryzae SG25]